MAAPSRTLSDLFSVYATDSEAMQLAMKITWPAIMRVTHHGETPTTKTHVLTSEIKTAIEHAVECPRVKNVALIGNAGSPFAHGTITDYCEKIPFVNSLACRLIETHRSTLRRRYETLGLPGTWLDFSDALKTNLNDFVGRPLVGPDGYWPQDEAIPKSSVIDAFLTILYCTFAYGVIDEMVGVKMFAPLLELAPSVIPIGESGEEPGAWAAAMIGGPIHLTWDI